MKRSTINTFISAGILIAMFILASCSKMNDTQREFAERAEGIYLGKVDSIHSHPGFGRAKLTWYISADPRIEQTVIYWNKRKDSMVVDFKRTMDGIQQDSTIINDLEEGTTLFEFKNINSQGESSLVSSAPVMVWGTRFGDGLHSRKLIGFDYNYGQKIYSLNLTPAAPGDSVIYSQIDYKNDKGEEKLINIPRDSDNVVLNNFPQGGALLFRTVFFLPEGIDTVYNNYDTLYAPAATFDKGVKLTLTGTAETQYYSRGDSLYEWTSTGDINQYVFQSDGSLKKTKTMAGVISRTDYNFFFFYDADKFIGINTANQVVMLQEEGDDFSVVKAFGNGFKFSNYIPGQGFFYSITPVTGDIRTWFAKDNATWDTPNGTTVGTGFDQYQPLMLFNYRYLLEVDQEGYLWSLPVSVDGKPGSRRRIGSGWTRFSKMISVGNRLLCMEPNGDFYIFDNFDPINKFWVVN